MSVRNVPGKSSCQINDCNDIAIFGSLLLEFPFRLLIMYKFLIHNPWRNTLFKIYSNVFLLKALHNHNQSTSKFIIIAFISQFSTSHCLTSGFLTQEYHWNSHSNTDGASKETSYNLLNSRWQFTLAPYSWQKIFFAWKIYLFCINI